MARAVGRAPHRAIALTVSLLCVRCANGDAAPIAAQGSISAPSSVAMSASPLTLPTPSPSRREGEKERPYGSPATATAAVPAPSGPLEGWMKENTLAALDKRDFRGLENALEWVARFPVPPAEYANWVSIAKDGADAARVENLDAVKAACRGCHAQYKKRYKKELHDKPL